MTNAHKANKLNDYVFIVPAYNEESTILDCLDSIFQASLNTKRYKLVRIIVCLNGCTDKTESLVKGWSKAQVDIIYAKQGYLNAMNELLRYSNSNFSKYVLFKTDADSTIDAKSITILYNQLELHKDLIIVGGHPYPLISSNLRFHKKLLSKIMSVRARTPEAEITQTDTAEYHQYSDLDPIPELKGREKMMKVYFHGRLWVARSANFVPYLPKHVIGDDVYLPGWLLQNHGLKSMRVDYRARVYFRPNHSIIRHWKVYRRIHEDRNIVYSMQGFEDYAKACPLKLDWKYIFFKCSTIEIFYFLVYAFLVKTERVTFKRIKYKTTFWQYAEKEQP